MIEPQRVSGSPRQRSVFDGAVVLIAFTALAVRLGWGLAMQPSPTAALSDAGWYHSAANLLRLGYGYVNWATLEPTALWPPGYPMILAAIYSVFGPDPRAALVLNAVVGTVTVIACWLLSLRITGSRRAAAVAAVIVALLPSHVFFTALVLTETLFTALLCVLVLRAGTLLESRPPSRLVPWLVWGAGVGVAALIRSEGVVLALVPGLVALVSASPRRVAHASRLTAAVLAGTVIVLVPWTYRNLTVSGSFVPTSTNFGRTLWIGHNADATGGMNVALAAHMDRTIEQEYRDLPGPIAEVVRNRRYVREAMSWALGHPRREIELLFLRVYHLWRGDHVWSSWYRYGPTETPLGARARVWLERISNVYFVAVLLAGMVGYAATVRSPRPVVRLLHVIVALWVMMHALIYGDPRFHFALLPILVVLGVEALARFGVVKSARAGADAALA